MNSTYKAEINTELIQWLNKETKASNHQLVLLDGFISMLQKIKHQGSVRLVGGSRFHQRFWKSLDRSLNYNLQREKKHVAPLYQFYFTVSVSANFIYFENGQGKLTDKGIKFLHKPSDQQLSFLLGEIWPC